MKKNNIAAVLLAVMMICLVPFKIYAAGVPSLDEVRSAWLKGDSGIKLSDYYFIYNYTAKDRSGEFYDFTTITVVDDTFYYSVLLQNDFTAASSDLNVKKLREYFNKFKVADFCDVVPISIPGCNVQLNYRAFTFSGMYKYCIECPEVFDIFIAETVPTEITSQVIVQLRSRPLWLDTTIGAFEYSYDVVKAVCKFFGLTITSVKENRVDYAWHTNYLQNPEQFFRIDNFAKMQVSRYKSVQYLYHFKRNDEYENDYIALGRRSDKCFVPLVLCAALPSGSCHLSRVA